MEDVVPLSTHTGEHRTGDGAANERSAAAQRTDDAQDGGAHARETQAGGAHRGGALPDPAEFPDRLDLIPTHQLRALCNSIFRNLDADQPVREARERYERVCEELDRRKRTAESRGKPDGVPEKIRDNPLFARFELHRDGVMAAYLQYELRGGEMRLLHTVVHPRFPRLELEPVLLRAVLLNAHRRRLAVVPCCPDAQRFLRENPGFLSLIPARQRRRYELLAAPVGATTPQEEHS